MWRKMKGATRQTIARNKEITRLHPNGNSPLVTKKTAKIKKKDLSSSLFSGVNQLIESVDADPNSAEKWTRYQTGQHQNPNLRECFAFGAMDHRLFLFGGIGGSNGGRLNELWMIDLAAPEMGWTKSQVIHNVPPPRSGHTMTTMPNHELWVFGGEGEYDPKGKAGTKRQIFGDLYAFNLIDREWRFIECQVGAPSFLPPSARRGHTANYVPLSGDRKGLLIFGGAGPDRMFAQDVFFNDVQVLELKHLVWSAKTEPDARGRKALGDVPSKRAWHTAALGNSPNAGGGAFLYVHGGISYRVVATTDGPRAHQLGVFHDDNEPPHTLAKDDVYQLDLLEWRWRKVRPSGRGPGPRYGHTATTSDTNPHLIYYFGGRTGDGKPDNQVWVLDTMRMQWSTPPTRGVAPCPRYSHAAAVSRGDMIIFGGSQFSSYCNSDLFMLKMKERPPPTPEDPPQTPLTPRYRIRTSRSITRGIPKYLEGTVEHRRAISGRKKKWPVDQSAMTRARTNRSVNRSNRSGLVTNRSGRSGLGTSRSISSCLSGHTERYGHCKPHARAAAGSGLWPNEDIVRSQSRRSKSMMGSRRTNKSDGERSTKVMVSAGKTLLKNSMDL
eukprot:g1856.t1